MIVIVKVGRTIDPVAARRGDFEALIADRAGLGEVRVVDPTRGDVLPAPNSAGGFVITGSSSMVTMREPWSVATAMWVRTVIAEGTPLLGICYGHQLIADGMGGTVVKNPRGREIGTIDVQLTDAAHDDPLFAGLPRTCTVQATHVESVTALPERATLLAHNAADPHQAFRVGERAWGVQFHPEFDADVIGGYLEARRDVLAAEGMSADALLASRRDSAHGAHLLRAFAKVAGQAPRSDR